MTTTPHRRTERRLGRSRSPQFSLIGFAAKAAVATVVFKVVCWPLDWLGLWLDLKFLAAGLKN